MSNETTIVPNHNPDLYVADPVLGSGEYQWINYIPIVAWAISAGASVDSKWYNSPDPITIEGGSFDESFVIINRKTGDWHVTDDCSGNGEDSLLRYFEEERKRLEKQEGR